jgi:hypothetical protein
MSPDQIIRIQLDELHTAQKSIKARLRRFNVLDCGRRFGKNILEKERAIDIMLAGYPVGWFEPTYKSLADMWRDMCSTLHPITKDKSEQEKRLQLITGGVIDMWSLQDPDSGRGRKYKLAVINEAAKVAKLEYAWTNVIRPTLADMKGAADFASTPKGLNYFFTLYSMAENNEDWARFRHPTSDNPHIDQGEVDAMRSLLPERVFRQEIQAEFIADGSFFQNVDASAIIESPDNLDQHAGHSIYGGLDWAMTNDYTVLTLGCRHCNRVVFWDRFNQIDYTYQRARIIDNCRRWNIAGLLPERNSIGQPNIELLAAAGLPILWGHDGQAGFSTTATTKPELIQSLAAALEHDGFNVPRDYADELRSYDVTTGQSGHLKFSAPEGQHDDRVMSLALCWWAMSIPPLFVGRY